MSTIGVDMKFTENIEGGIESDWAKADQVLPLNSRGSDAITDHDDDVLINKDIILFKSQFIFVYALAIFVGNEIGCFTSIKQVAPNLLLDVFLPTIDTYSDLSLIIPWIIASHYNYAASMTFPLFLNFAATVAKWYQLEKREDKKWSWVPLLLQFWPQLRSLRVIRLMYLGDARADKKKKKLQEEIGCYEAMLEAVPSIMIMTLIWLSAGGLDFGDFHHYDCDATNRTASYINYRWKYESSLDPHYYLYTNLSLDEYQNEYVGKIWFNNLMEDHNTRCDVYGNYDRIWWFYTNYMISIITGSLGVTKMLQIGPCPILKIDGPLLGMGSCKFIMCYLAVLLSIVGKGLYLATSIPSNINSTTNNRSTLSIVCVIFLCLNVLPNLMLAVFSLVHAIGFNKTLLKMIRGYPIFLVLPIFTPFMIGQKKNCRHSQTENNSKDNQLGVSTRLTIMNLSLSVWMLLISSICIAYVIGYLDLNYYFQPLLVIVIPSLILVIMFTCFTIFNEPCCGSCCYACCVDTTHTFRTFNTDGHFFEYENSNEHV